MKYGVFLWFLILLAIWSCENRAINEGEEFRPKEIHENIEYHFDKIQVDGIEYLILSRDNNNPHEGFGFMAFRANQLLLKQDSMMAYLQAMNRMQLELYAQTMRMSNEDADNIFRVYFEDALQQNPDMQQKKGVTYSSTPREKN